MRCRGHDLFDMDLSNNNGAEQTPEHTRNRARIKSLNRPSEKTPEQIPATDPRNRTQNRPLEQTPRTDPRTDPQNRPQNRSLEQAFRTDLGTTYYYDMLRRSRSSFQLRSLELLQTSLRMSMP